MPVTLLPTSQASESSASTASTASVTSPAAAAPPATKGGPAAAAPADSFVAVTGGDALLAAKKTPLPAAARPADFAANLVSAQQKLASAVAAGTFSEADPDLLLAENNKLAAKGDKQLLRLAQLDPSQKNRSDLERERVGIARLARSARERHTSQKFRSKTQIAEMTKKLNFSKQQATSMARTLSEGRIDDDVREQLAGKLAALAAAGAPSTTVAAAVAQRGSPAHGKADEGSRQEVEDAATAADPPADARFVAADQQAAENALTAAVLRAGHGALANK